MARYRKKPEIVEAERWLPVDYGQVPTVGEVPMRCSRDGLSEAQKRHMGPAKPDPLGVFYNKRTGMYGVGWFVETLEGWMRVSHGDWIITGVKGNKYPCKPDIFQLTYEPVEESQE